MKASDVREQVPRYRMTPGRARERLLEVRDLAVWSAIANQGAP